MADICQKYDDHIACKNSEHFLMEIRNTNQAQKIALKIICTAWPTFSPDFNSDRSRNWYHFQVKFKKAAI